VRNELTIPAIAADNTLYPIGKMAAHRERVFHLAVSVFVFSAGELLLQRRAAGKYHSGGLWANTCCSHPNWGESLERCARRRLDEELGIDLALRPAGIIEYSADVGAGLWEHERVAVFFAEADDCRALVEPNPEEVSDFAWMPIGDLRRRVAARPSEFAPWLRIYVSRWDELGLSPQLRSVS
jgi:isopentenyl-diphosphate Delta-isomerase